MSDEQELATIEQMIGELYHCIEAGPSWFTQGRMGQMAHARMWVDRGIAALRTMRDHEGPKVTEIQRLRGNMTPNDIERLEAMRTTIVEQRMLIEIHRQTIASLEERITALIADNKAVLAANDKLRTERECLSVAYNEAMARLDEQAAAGGEWAA